ncbi:MAG: glycosyl hydrolase family 18 protein, partial [Anaerovorax sp.]
GDILLNIQEKGMTGIDFDFEYVFPENKDDYVELVRKTAEILNPKGYLVTVALAPKTSTDQKGLLYEGHDYKGMGLAANYVLLMTYEWGYKYGPPMAVAPMNKVRQVLDYGVTQIQPSKILMGIPNYGYDWKLPFVKGASKAEKVTNGEAVARAQRMGVEIQFDPVAMSPYYFYTKPIEGSNPPAYEDHEVWFEDRRSLEAKLALVPQYGLAGISIWNIMYPYF